MFSHSSRRSECGYGPIGPFTDNCPICAGPVQSGGGAGSVLQSIKANVWVGWLVILGVSFYFHGGNWGPLLFMAAPAGAAWWFIKFAGLEAPDGLENRDNVDVAAVRTDARQDAAALDEN
jgi:hypothetical protein